FRKLVLTRLDSIGYGVAGALLHSYAPLFWKQIRYYALGAGILILAVMCKVHTFPVTFFLQTSYLSWMSLAIALFLPVLSAMKEEPIPGKPVRWISRISYSLYLSNLLLVQLFVKYLHPQSTGWIVLEFLCCWAVVFGFAWLVYTGVEKPFLRLRDRMSDQQLKPGSSG
ncbi:MAG TPA: hypothetical protein VNZ86_18020, partial [Bacteroidia bacterium]|nr:hypothetical protein [Bacteroidia bacterium]